ncbi:IPExxxVDY family protein [Arenibacter sp. GZD96]|uniref:IPExxxVDY family protein n=1 Tax=Aurantibrevibacter litoralis TaxID=3106030 RepID=UPI002AFDED2B|nr:IPExxxVDY family protein [Arenibacter sp. GZD-96]MEA1785666.1 IPExxxVDY family protein [Arenibacter sp. GZD-96]
MAAIHKILTNSLTVDTSYVLIALHSDLDDYAIAYGLNAFLGSALTRCRTDLDLTEDLSFPAFEWHDQFNDTVWYLFKNESIQQLNTIETGLFKDEVSVKKTPLLPEFKVADYFLKIENDETDAAEAILQSLLKIPNIVTAYTVPLSKIKSKNNLIFP